MVPRARILQRCLWSLSLGLVLSGTDAAVARELRLELAASHSSNLQVYFGHTVFDFTEVNSTAQPFVGDGQFHEIRLKVPDWEQLTLRLDPGSAAGTVQLRRLRVFDDENRLLASIPAAALEPLQQVEVRAAPGAEESVSLVIPPGSNDPAVLVNEMTLRTLLDRSHHVTKTGFLLLCVALGSIVVAGGIVALRWCASGDPALRRWQVPLIIGILFLVVGTRLATLSQKVSWAPYLDQFEGELGTLIAPFQKGVLRWSEFAAPHNDHRIATTRIVSLAAFLANGEWDNRVLAVANCLLQGLGVAWFCLFVLRERPGREAALLIVFTAGGSVFLNDWANVAVGFQIQFHLVLLSSLLALTLMPNARSGSAASWVGFFAGVFAAITLGSGFLAVVAGIAGVVLRWWIDRRVPRGAWVLLGLSIAVAIAAWQTRAVFPALDHLRARTVAHWFSALWMYGGWPLPPSWIAFAAMWLPWLVVTLRQLRRREGSPFQIFLTTMGVWLLLQIAALAWGRAGYAPVMSSRYTGLLLWSSVVAVASLAVLCSSSDTVRPRLRSLLLLAPAAAAVVLGAFLLWRSLTFFGPQFSEFVAQTREHESRLGTFMRDRDPRVFSAVEFPHKPYPLNERLVSLLQEPGLREAWPAPMRRERFRLSDPEAFGRVRTGPLTRVARFLLRAGPALIFIGSVLIAWAFFRQSKTPLLDSRQDGSGAPPTGPAVEPTN